MRQYFVWNTFRRYCLEGGCTLKTQYNQISVDRLSCHIEFGFGEVTFRSLWQYTHHVYLYISEREQTREKNAQKHTYTFPRRKNITILGWHQPKTQQKNQSTLYIICETSNWCCRDIGNEIQTNEAKACRIPIPYWGGTLDVYYHSILMENTRSPSLAPLDALIRFISALWRLSNKQPVLFIVSHEREKKSHTGKGANKQWFWANVQFNFVPYGLAVALW